MGGRNSFLDIDNDVFEFKEGGQHYKSIGVLSSNPNVKVIVQDSKSVKAPEYSHTAGKIYAVIKDNHLKHLAYYDETHKQAICIDLAHEHRGVKPHRHAYMDHRKKVPGIPPTEAELELIGKIKKEFGLL